MSRVFTLRGRAPGCGERTFLPWAAGHLAPLLCSPPRAAAASSLDPLPIPQSPLIGERSLTPYWTEHLWAAPCAEIQPMAVQISGRVSTLTQSEASLALGLVLDPRPGEGLGACRSGEDMEDEVTGTFSASVLDRQWLGQS